MATHPAHAHLRLVSATVAEIPFSADQHAARELIIVVSPEHGLVQYKGTAAELQAEGLIPEGFEWPRARDDRCWEANGLRYWLRRARPEGHKGPMRSWLEMDNWRVRVDVSDRDYQWRVQRRLARKTEELHAEYYRHSAAGQREWQAACDRYCKACQDKAFQAFKATFVPQSKKKGRPAKVSHEAGSARPN